MRAVFTLSQAIQEASRCLLCHDAPCSAECPAKTDPGTFIRKLRFRNIKGAVRTIKENNILGGVCGVVCPVSRLCQKACSATEIDRPIEIGDLQRFLVEYGWDTGFFPVEKAPANEIKVAVVGSGPAGLAGAAELAKNGFAVAVFEAREKAGGVLRYGVPEFRLNSAFLDREIEDLKKLGVVFHCKNRIGPQGVDKLFKQGFQAVFVAPGLWSPRKVRIPGSDLVGVATAAEFLESVRRGSPAQAAGLVKNKNVAIIGGGSVAMDIATTAKALGAKKVYSICLESLAEIPADQDDLQLARDNFVILKPQCQLTEIVGRRGRVTGVKGTETEWVRPKLFVPSNARAVPGTEFSLRVGAVIMAVGTGPEPSLRELSSRIAFAKNGSIAVRQDGVSTADPRIFAGGDIVRGPALVVQAVADGKEAAKRIAARLAK
jgi:NADPH-dependent glutamate synthase beta subunit-like oxidoreductase